MVGLKMIQYFQYFLPIGWVKKKMTQYFLPNGWVKKLPNIFFSGDNPF